ncbi:pyrimidine-specific ribonucleoside hydrolase RihA [Klebsiella pneumoniae]
MIDCDPGHDDAIALVLALASPELEVKAVTASAGNQTPEKTLRNVLRMLTLLNRPDIPVAGGAWKPLMRDLIIADNVHGESGLDGPSLPEPAFAPQNCTAVELMASVLRESQEPVTLVATGPQTNVALLLASHPELHAKIARIVIMGGAMGLGNWQPAAEFNIYVDPQAAEMVFQSGIPVVMAGLDVTHKAQILPADIERFRQIGNPVSTIVAELLDFFMAYHKDEKWGFDGAPLHDPCTIAWLLKPEIFTTIERWVGVETEGKYTQGMLVDGTSRAGIEAILVSAIRPGDKVLVPVFGRFGHLLCEIARRCRAEVHTIEVPWGEVFTPDQVEDAIKRVRPRLLLTVQGDTSTTMLQPLAELGEICRRHDVLFYTDATASLGGNLLETDAWQLDAVSAGMQKCLGGPSGTSPITLSPRMEEVIRRRRCIEQGIRTDAHHDGVDEMIYSNYFDLGMVMDYWGPERLNHHTEATSALFAARECARLILQEGLDNGIARHKLHGDALLKGIQAMGLETFGDLRHKMNNVLGVVIPNGINGDQVRKLMLEDFGIEIGTSFGPLHGKVWRIGTMGYNARKDCVMQTLSALEAVLNYLKFTTTQGAAMQAAWDHYRNEATL